MRYRRERQGGRERKKERKRGNLNENNQWGKVLEKSQHASNSYYEKGENYPMLQIGKLTLYSRFQFR